MIRDLGSPMGESGANFTLVYLFVASTTVHLDSFTDTSVCGWE